MIVLSLFDYTGVAGRPWEEAGYSVLNCDIQHAGPTHQDIRQNIRQNSGLQRQGDGRRPYLKQTDK